MTTIGYGDISPRTVTSKVLLCIFGVVGTGFIALPAVYDYIYMRIIYLVSKNNLGIYPMLTDLAFAFLACFDGFTVA